MELGYGRVSTLDQNPDLQRDALEAAGLDSKRIYIDKLSGKLTQRPELDRVLEQLRPGDVLVVWKLDRLGRSTQHLLDILRDLRERGVAFRSLTEGIDTTNEVGELIYMILAWLAQQEHTRILERTKAGLESARRRGRMGGRPRKMTATKLKHAQGLADSGQLTMDEIAELLGVHRATLYRYLRR